MSDKLWILDESGEAQLVSYEELDQDIYPQLWRPTGTISYAAGSFLNLPLAETPFFIQDWLPLQGKAEIFGSAKAGKSFLATQMARCVGEGKPFLGLPTKAGRVLYLQFELGTAVLQKRMRDTGYGYDNVYVGTTFGMKLDKASGQKLLLHELDAVKPELLILDPWYKIISGDENEQQDTEVITDFIDSAVIDGFGCSVVFMHHTGKDPTRGGRGSSVLEGWVDSFIELKKVSKEGETLRVRLAPKLLRHAMCPPQPLELFLGDDFEFHEGEAVKTVYEKASEYIVGKATVKVQEMVDAGLGSRKAVDDARKKLIAEGKLTDSGERGVYLVKEASDVRLQGMDSEQGRGTGGTTG